MSHFSRITVSIKDLKALEQAVKKMNLRFEHNTECRYYYGTSLEENVIKLPGKYDVAVIGEKGNYDLKADLYSGEVESWIGHGGRDLMKEYAVEKLKLEAKKNGYKVYGQSDKLKLIDKEGRKAVVTMLPDGKINVETTGFKGSSCISNFGIIEEALGTIDSMKKKPEYYQTEAEKVHIKEEW